MSKTNKAFERYLGQAEDDDILSIYRQSAQVIPINQIDTGLIPSFEGSQKAKQIYLLSFYGGGGDHRIDQASY